MNDAPLTKQPPPLQIASLREQSLSTIQAAIRSPSDPGATLKRTNTVLSLYFDPDTDPATRLAMREEFVRALDSYPEWAMQRAFDAWVKRGNRRPSPGEIALLAQQEIAPLVTELRNRTRATEPRQFGKTDRVSHEAAAEIMARAGFGPKGMAERKPHWTDAIAPGQEQDADAIRRAKINAGIADA